MVLKYGNKILQSVHSLMKEKMVCQSICGSVYEFVSVYNILQWNYQGSGSVCCTWGHSDKITCNHVSHRQYTKLANAVWSWLNDLSSSLYLFCLLDGEYTVKCNLSNWGHNEKSFFFFYLCKTLKKWFDIKVLKAEKEESFISNSERGCNLVMNNKIMF